MVTDSGVGQSEPEMKELRRIRLKREIVLQPKLTIGYCVLAYIILHMYIVQQQWYVCALSFNNLGEL